MNREARIQSLFPSEEAIPSDVKLDRYYEDRGYLAGGEIHSWSGDMQKVYSPVCVDRDGEIEQVCIGEYPMLTEFEATQALDSAVAAYNMGRGEWPMMSVEERIAHVERFVFLMKEKREEVVKLLMWEIGKTRADSEKEFDRTVVYIQDTIDALKQLDRVSARFEIREGIYGQIRRSPLGVALCMGPFNYPLNETFTTLIPALIMGNTVIFKPPKFGVLLHYPLMEAFRDAFPVGVVNIVFGDGQRVISPIMQSGKVDVLAFIGSSSVADILKKQHPKPHRMRAVLGLEAKNAGIVLPDANIDHAVSEVLTGGLSYNGQRCTAIKIVFLHESIADEFLEKLKVALATLTCGMPWEEGVKLTPLPETGKTDQLRALIKDAEAHGARVINEGGGSVNHTFMYPAVLYPVNEKMRIYREEQFGPIVPIRTFSDIEEPMEYIIHSDYGQQTSIFGEDPEAIAVLVDTLVNQVCRVNLNSQCQRGPDTFPFTGRKDSAEGTLSVSDALRVFSIRSLVAAKGTEMNKEIMNDILKENRSRFLSTDFIF